MYVPSGTTSSHRSLTPPWPCGGGTNEPLLHITILEENSIERRDTYKIHMLHEIMNGTGVKFPRAGRKLRVNAKTPKKFDHTHKNRSFRDWRLSSERKLL